MTNNDTLRNLLVAGGLFLVVLWIGPKLITLPERPQEIPSQGSGLGGESQPGLDGHQAELTQSSSGAGAAGAQADSTTPSSKASGIVVRGAEAEETVTLGAGVFENGAKPRDYPFRMRLELTNRGAAVSSAVMTDQAELVGDPVRYELLSTIERSDGSRFHSLAIEKINIDGHDVSLLDKFWHVEPIQSEQDEFASISFRVDIERDGQPVVRVVRTFRLPKQSTDSGLHDLDSTVSVQNRSKASHQIIVSYRGGLVTKQADSRVPDLVADWGISSGGYVTGDRQTYETVAAKADTATVLYQLSTASPDARISWAASGNKYFTCTLAPLNRRDAGLPESHIASVDAFDVDGSAFTVDDTTVRFVSRQETLSPGSSLRYPTDIYLGAKNAESFRSEERYLSRNYYYQISQGFGACAVTVLVELMIWLLNTLYPVFQSYGVAIIVMVMLVRTLLHPITKKGQVNMVKMQQKMQDMQPKIEEIKKKYANDKARLNQEMMKLNINPAGQMITCIPMLIQMPIWIALYMSLSNNILMRHEPAFWGLTWITDLTAPDAFYTFGSPVHIPIFGWELPHLNILPFFLAASMYVQQKLQPKPKPNPNATDQQRAQQEMMQKMGPMMSIMMLLIFYKMPSGLNLYIMASSIFGAIEQWRIRLHIKEREATGTLHKAEPPPPDPSKPQKRKKPSFIERLQRAAEEAQRVQSQKAGKKRGKSRG